MRVALRRPLPKVFSEAGGVLEGKLTAYGSEDIYLEVSFSGRDEQVPQMLELINPNGIVWQRSDGICRWSCLMIYGPYAMPTDI